MQGWARQWNDKCKTEHINCTAPPDMDFNFRQLNRAKLLSVKQKVMID